MLKRLHQSRLIRPRFIELVSDPRNVKNVGLNKYCPGAREPSSSPPPVTAPPPRVEFMREGSEADDAWIMVEDEFWSTAKLFTQHLHQAEYYRLKQLAKDKTANRVKVIIDTAENELTGSATTKLRERSEALASRQKAVLEPYLSDEDSDNNPLSENPHLALIVSEPRVPSHRLSRIAGTKANTRAAAGYGRSVRGDTYHSQREVAKDRHDDLHDPSIIRIEQDHEAGLTASSARSLTPTTRPAGARSVQGVSSRERNTRKSLTSEDLQSESIARKGQRLTAIDGLDLDDDFPFMKNESTKHHASISQFERKAKRKAEQEQTEKPQSVTLKHVPTFLI